MRLEHGLLLVAICRTAEAAIDQHRHDLAEAGNTVFRLGDAVRPGQAKLAKIVPQVRQGAVVEKPSEIMRSVGNHFAFDDADKDSLELGHGGLRRGFASAGGQRGHGAANGTAVARCRAYLAQEIRVRRVREQRSQQAIKAGPQPVLCRHRFPRRYLGVRRNGMLPLHAALLSHP